MSMILLVIRASWLLIVVIAKKSYALLASFFRSALNTKKESPRKEAYIRA